MVAKLFWQNSYRTTLDTRIAAVEGDQVRLEETIFYAFSGGQESDVGTIGECKVLEARKDGRDIVYRLEPDHGLKTGDSVTIGIDGVRRLRLMRLHLAAEIILELAYQNLPGIQKIGAHIAEDKARIDFEWPENISKLFPMMQEKAAALIAADHAIVSAFSDEANQRRYWENEGFARVPCGGTHLKRTGEIGAIALKRVNIGKGKERIEIRLAG
ncbi:alanyl-tRNA editing protein [Dongia deserti]|uniref:alanyl-tRNA editing protein n=1 Tax=Dongia deserti TaxID=2268030 RepID=UPI000E64B95A|nr:alanyl-tRNA editing protein [Dongia deserti]